MFSHGFGRSVLMCFEKECHGSEMPWSHGIRGSCCLFCVPGDAHSAGLLTAVVTWVRGSGCHAAGCIGAGLLLLALGSFPRDGDKRVEGSLPGHRYTLVYDSE